MRKCKMHMLLEVMPAMLMLEVSCLCLYNQWIGVVLLTDERKEEI